MWNLTKDQSERVWKSLVTDDDVVHEGYPHTWTNQHAEPEYRPADMSSYGERAGDESDHLEDGGDDGDPPEGDDFQERRDWETRRVHEDREGDDCPTKFLGFLYNNNNIVLLHAGLVLVREFRQTMNIIM